MKLTQLLALAFLAITPAIAGPEDRTANSVKALAETLIGKEVTVETTHVASVRGAGNEEVSVFVAHTHDTSQNLPAGSIMVAVLKEDLESFVKKFGTTPDVGGDRPVRDRDTTKLTGVLQETEKHLAYIDMTDGKATAEVMAKAGHEAGGEKKDETPNRGGGKKKPNGKPGTDKKKTN